MESLVRKLLLTSCILMGGAVAFLPLTSYALTDEELKNVELLENVDKEGVTTYDKNGVSDTLTETKAANRCVSSRVNQNDVSLNTSDQYRDAETMDGATPYVTSAMAGLTPEKTQVAAGRVTAPAATSSDGNTVVCVNVDTVLSLDFANIIPTNKDDGSDLGDYGDPIEIFPGMTGTGRLDVKVRSAKNYSILLSAEEPHLYNELHDASIPSVANPEYGKNNGWGIKNPIKDEFSAIKQYPVVFYNGVPTDTVADNENGRVTTSFPINVAVSPKLPQDTYSTDITVTATTRE